MDTGSTKKKHVIPPIFGIVFIALVVTVIVQAGYITKLNRELKKKSLSGRSLKDNSSKTKNDNASTKMDMISEVDISDKEKIEKLEAQVADMQTWQDYLEESLKKEKNVDDDRSEIVRSSIRLMFSSQLDSFVEETGLPPDIKKKLYDVLVEKSLEIQDLYTGDTPYEERQKETEYINQKYDDMISELLADKYNAYKEYMKVQNERDYINNFKNSMMMGDNWLEKQQEKRLITAIYNDRQSITDLYKEKMIDSNMSETARIKENFEIQKMLYNRYIDSAKDILSESQLRKFKKYIDLEISNIEMRTNSMISQAANREEQEAGQ